MDSQHYVTEADKQLGQQVSSRWRNLYASIAPLLRFELIDGENGNSTKAQTTVLLIHAVELSLAVRRLNLVQEAGSIVPTPYQEGV